MFVPVDAIGGRAIAPLLIPGERVRFMPTGRAVRVVAVRWPLVFVDGGGARSWQWWFTLSRDEFAS